MGWGKNSLKKKDNSCSHPLPLGSGGGSPDGSWASTSLQGGILDSLQDGWNGVPVTLRRFNTPLQGSTMTMTHISCGTPQAETRQLPGEGLATVSALEGYVPCLPIQSAICLPSGGPYMPESHWARQPTDYSTYLGQFYCLTLDRTWGKSRFFQDIHAKDNRYQGNNWAVAFGCRIPKKLSKCRL